VLRTAVLGALFLIALSQPVLAERGAKDEYGNHQHGHVGGGGLRLCAIQLCDFGSASRAGNAAASDGRRGTGLPRFP
jgi:hypothetical protein